MYLKRNNELNVLMLYLSGYKKRFYLREISVLTKIPLKTTQNIVAFLEKRKILKSIIEGKNKYFSLNKENIETKWYLVHAELYKTQFFVEKYPQFKLFLKALDAESTVVLFGSFAKGSADKNSDCDLLLVSEKEESIPTHLLAHQIHKIEMTPKAYKEATEKRVALIEEIEENHIVLNNHSVFVEMMWRKWHGK